MSEIGFGVLGCGMIGPVHCKSAKMAKGGKLVAVCDGNAERAKALADEYACDCLTSYEDLLARDDVHAIGICTPTSMHLEQGRMAAEHGKHVICEKPIATNLDDGRKLIEACAKNGVKLGVIFQRRAGGVWPVIKRFVDDGRLGRLLMGDTSVKYYRNKDYYDSASTRGTWKHDGGGALMIQAIHLLDVTQWIMGGISSLYGYAATLVHNIEVEDTAACVVKYRNGAVGVMEGAVTVVPPTHHTMEIHGTKGSIVVHGETVVKWSLWDEETQKETDLLVEDEEIRKLTSVEYEWCQGHYDQYQDLVHAINDDRPPVVTGEDSLEALRIVLAIYESSRTGKPIDLD